MSLAKTGDTVRVHYQGTLDDGSVFDSSLQRDPLEFTLGSGQVIPGFDQGVTGMSIGESKTVVLPPDQAYGAVVPEMIGKIPNNQFPPHITPEIGMMLQMQAPNGTMLNVTITGMDDEGVTLDGNHPLAGKQLTFELTLVEIN